MRPIVKPLAALVLLMACAAPRGAFALNDRETVEVNKKLFVIRLDESFAKGEVANAKAPGTAVADACAHLQRAQVYSDEAMAAAARVRTIIGPDALHEHADVFKMLAAAQLIDADLKATIKDGCL